MKFKKKEYGTAKKGKFCGTNNIGYVKKRRQAEVKRHTAMR